MHERKCKRLLFAHSGPFLVSPRSYRTQALAEPASGYVVNQRGASQGVIQTRIDKALLPKWPNGSESPRDSYHEIQIPAGTKVYVGEVGYQTDLFSGSSEQVVIPTPWKIPVVKIPGSGGLK